MKRNVDYHVCLWLCPSLLSEQSTSFFIEWFPYCSRFQELAFWWKSGTAEDQSLLSDQASFTTSWNDGSSNQLAMNRNGLSHCWACGRGANRVRIERRSDFKTERWNTAASWNMTCQSLLQKAQCLSWTPFLPRCNAARDTQYPFFILNLNQVKKIYFSGSFDHDHTWLNYEETWSYLI